MEITGIICEYNPLHLGHKKQIDAIRRAFPDGGIVCLMSGNYVQRGHPAIFSEDVRARAAVESGADLVLEMPTAVSLSSAEGFAAGGVHILSPFCDRLCFGAENADADLLTETAKLLLSAEFSEALRLQLDKGLSFPAARQAAMEAMGKDTRALVNPNDILAVEYCKAILHENGTIQPYSVFRGGDYHAETADFDNPSATAVRARMLAGEEWDIFVPLPELFRGAPMHAMAYGERAVLSCLRSMTPAEFEALPFGSEGLWRKLMHAAYECASLEEILTAVKSKRYTRSRLDRMVMCAFLGITRQMPPAPYVRVLALNARGGEILKKARQSGRFLNVGQPTDEPYAEWENRCSRLYGLFCADAPERADNSARVSYTE